MCFCFGAAKGFWGHFSISSDHLGCWGFLGAWECLGGHFEALGDALGRGFLVTFGGFFGTFWWQFGGLWEVFGGLWMHFGNNVWLSCALWGVSGTRLASFGMSWERVIGFSGQDTGGAFQIMFGNFVSPPPPF